MMMVNTNSDKDDDDGCGGGGGHDLFIVEWNCIIFYVSIQLY